MQRRHFSKGMVCAALGTATTFTQKSWAQKRQVQLMPALQELEAKAQGRLGVHVLDTASGQAYGYRSDERFMMLSSFKWLASALVLARVDRGDESLDRRIRYRKQDLVPWSPVTQLHVDGDGLTLAQLCNATITTSDNTAGNLVLDSFGGPSALTAFARQHGDSVTRLDRYEPDLNVRQGAELLDTTSPRAMAQALQKLVLGDALSVASRQLLQRWLLANTTGGRRLKAGVPVGWCVGDKTGTNSTDTNDVGLLWPPHGAPLVVAAYLADSTASHQTKDATMAIVGRLVTGLLYP
jgi:beta-lactamase class A